MISINSTRVVVLVEGEDLSLECLATGNPTPEVYWIRTNDNSVITKSSKLMLSNITKTYSGVLQCVAWNGIGSNASANVTLNVLCEYLEHDLDSN